MKKLLVSLMLIIAGVVAAQQTATTAPVTLDPGQIYTTGNLVNWTPPSTTTPSTLTTSPWINGVYQQSLTCWAWGNPGNCGPLPTVTPGNINFSFGTTDIHQVTSIAAALPNSGTGLNVNGYNFSFSAKNGNGWDNGQQDYLMAYVRFYGPNGSTVANYDYNLNYKFDWTYFNLSKTFDTPYASKDLTAAQYGFIGRDNNYWAGTYGPEITNISFSLKYSVDPCATNPMFSPTCPGYLDALAKIVPASTTTTIDPIASTSSSPTTTTSIVTDPITSTVNVTSTSTIGQPSTVAPIVSAPSSTTTTTSSATVTSSQTQKESSGSSSNTSLALSIINKNSERDAAGAAVAQSAVAQAQQAANQAQQEAASVAANAVANSISANIVTGSNQSSTGTGIRVTASNTASTISTGSISTSANMGNGVTLNSVTSGVIQQSFDPIVPTSIIQSTTNVATNIPSMTTQSTETYSLIPSNFLTDRANPLNDIIEGKQVIPQNNTIANLGSSVNKNAGDNDVAGGVSINKIAQAPIGYNEYLNLTLKDVAFYAPKEVYKNQRNVDNARALRQMMSDTKHREMTEMQYGK